MEPTSTYRTMSCEGCARFSFVLHIVDDAKLCEGCVEKSALIDEKLAQTQSEDPVFCDECRDHLDFDAKVAVVVRACGGAVLCDRCKPAVADREAMA